MFNYNSKQIKSVLLLFHSLRWSTFRVLISRGPLAITEIHGLFQNTFFLTPNKFDWWNFCLFVKLVGSLKLSLRCE